MIRKEILSHDDEQEMFNKSVRDYVAKCGYTMSGLTNEKGNKLVMRFIGNCKMCPMSQNKTILPTYVKDPKIIVINQVSGNQERVVEAILPPTYPAGKVYDKYLSTLGMKREEVYLTTSVFCSKLQYLPTMDCQKKCRMWKDLEMTYINIPKVIILLGEGTLQSFYNDFSLSMNKEYGNMYVTRYKGEDRIVVPMYHPVTYLREDSYREQIDHMLKLIGELVRQDKVDELIEQFNKEKVY